MLRIGLLKWGMDTVSVARRPPTRHPLRGWVLRIGLLKWGMDTVCPSRHQSPLPGRAVGCAPHRPPKRWLAGGSWRTLLEICSAQSHPIPAGSHFLMLAPSGPLGVELCRASLPLSACQPLPPAPGRAPVSRRARLLYLPTSSPRTRTCDDYTQHPAPPTAESLSDRRKPGPRPSPSRRPPLGPHPHPYADASPPTSYLPLPPSSIVGHEESVVQNQ